MHPETCRAVTFLKSYEHLSSGIQKLQIPLWLLGKGKEEGRGLSLLKDDLCDLSKTAECSGIKTLSFIKNFNAASGTFKKSKEIVFCIKVSPQNILILSRVST